MKGVKIHTNGQEKKLYLTKREDRYLQALKGIMRACDSKKGLTWSEMMKICQDHRVTPIAVTRLKKGGVITKDPDTKLWEWTSPVMANIPMTKRVITEVDRYLKEARIKSQMKKAQEEKREDPVQATLELTWTPEMAQEPQKETSEDTSPVSDMNTSRFGEMTQEWLKKALRHLQILSHTEKVGQTPKVKKTTQINSVLWGAYKKTRIIHEEV